MNLWLGIGCFLLVTALGETLGYLPLTIRQLRQASEVSDCRRLDYVQDLAALPGWSEWLVSPASHNVGVCVRKDSVRDDVTSVEEANSGYEKCTPRQTAPLSVRARTADGEEINRQIPDMVVKSC